MKIEKTKEQVAAEIVAIMRERHGRTYKYRQYDIWGSLRSNTVIKIVAEYRHGSIEIDNFVSQVEIRNQRLEGLGI